MDRRWSSESLIAFVLLALTACSAEAGQADTVGSARAAPSDPAAGGAASADQPAATSDAADPGESLPSELPDACGVLAADGVASVLGHSVEADDGFEGFCLWLPTDPADGVSASLSLVPMFEEDCVDSHTALGATEMFEYDTADLDVPAFQRYSETTAGTHVATIELCTPRINAGVRIEAPEADEEAHLAMAAGLVPLVLEGLGDGD